MDDNYEHMIEDKRYKYRSKEKIGELGQSAAEKYLSAKGYILIARNVRIGNYGEIDLIYRSREGKIIFIEVKSSFSTNPLFSSYERINRGKKIRLYGLVKRYCYIDSINMDENAEIYLAHILIFYKSTISDESNMLNRLEFENSYKALYFRPYFYKLHFPG